MKQILYLFAISLLYQINANSQCYTDRHTTNGFDGWVSCEKSMNPNSAHGESHWISYDFGSSYPLHDMVIWNMNHPEYLDDGFKDVIVEYSNNGSIWTLFDTITIPRASASGFYEGVNGPDLEGLTARYLLLTALNNHGGGCYGLSEIKVFTSDQEETEFNLAFTPCEGDGILKNINGGMEMDGTFSGPGVQDNNDETFDFNAAIAGPGWHNIAYTHTGGTLTAKIQVLSCTNDLCANCPDCGDFDEQLVNNNPIPSDTYYDNLLNSSGTVAASSPVSLMGKESVTMGPGFSVGVNTDFIAEIRACDENFLANGGFEHDTMDWEFFVSPWNPVTASIDVNSPPYKDEKTARVLVTQNDGGAWQVSLNQYNYTIEQGSEYEVSFYSRKESGGEFILYLQQDDDPNYHTFEWERITVTDLWQKYTYTFTAAITAINTVRFSMLFGEGNGEWFFDRIQLIKKS